VEEAEESQGSWTGICRSEGLRTNPIASRLQHDTEQQRRWFKVFEDEEKKAALEAMKFPSPTGKTYEQVKASPQEVKSSPLTQVTHTEKYFFAGVFEFAFSSFL